MFDFFKLLFPYFKDNLFGVYSEKKTTNLIGSFLIYDEVFIYLKMMLRTKEFPFSSVIFEI